MRRANRWVARVTAGAIGMGLVCFLASPAMADQALEIKLLNDETAPIQLVEAHGRLRTFQATPTAREYGGSRRTAVKYANVKAAQSESLHWEGSARYRNTSRKRVEGVQLEWKFLNNFREQEAKVEVSDQWGVLPGRERARDWAQLLETDRTPKALNELTQATVRVVAVRFYDGTVWTPPTLEAERPSEPSAARAERERLRRLYEEQGFEALMEALRE